MYKPKITQLSATSSEQTMDVGINVHTIIVKNDGDISCYIDFDNSINSSTSYLLEPGEVVTLEELIIRRVHYKTASGTTTLGVIRLMR